MLRAGLSLTDPAGLLPSNFAKIVFEVSPGSRCSRTSGVFPIQASIVGYCIGGCVGQNPEHDECTHDPGHTEHGSDRVETVPHGPHNLSRSQSALHCLNADKEEHAAPRMRSIEEQRKEPS